MFNEERIFFEAWLDEENRIVSFHEISTAGTTAQRSTIFGR